MRLQRALVRRLATAPDQLALFAQSLGPDDRVALERPATR
jgi:hypothetical protein